MTAQMDNLTAESAAVRLYAASGNGDCKYALQLLAHDRPLASIWESVATEHERLCAERIATAEREARVRGLREALAEAEAETADWRSHHFLSESLGAGCVRKRISDLITAAEIPPPDVDAQPSVEEHDHG